MRYHIVTIRFWLVSIYLSPAEQHWLLGEDLTLNILLLVWDVLGYPEKSSADNTEYCVGEKFMRCLLTNFVHNLRTSGLVLSEGNLCIIIPGVCIEFLQLTPPGPPQTQYLPPRFTGAFCDSAILANIKHCDMSIRLCMTPWLTGHMTPWLTVQKKFAQLLLIYRIFKSF